MCVVMTNAYEHCGVARPIRPFSLIFFMEMWERFGYYGTTGLLVIYIINKLNFSDDLTIQTFAAFMALCYAFISIGGFVGDKILGTKRAILIGAITLCAGYILLSWELEKHIYWGLATIIAGNMIFKANPSSLVSKLYKKGDPRIDSAFTMYYMAINIGSFISLTICPIIQVNYGFSAAFLMCAFGLFLSVVGYLTGKKMLSEIGSPPDFKPLNFIDLIGATVGIFVVIVACVFFLKHLKVTHTILALMTIATFAVLIWLAITAKEKSEKNSYTVCIILMLEAIIFYVLYQQMPTSLNLFTIRNTDCTFFGIHMPGPAFQNMNPFWILVGSPILAWLYNHLGKKGKDFSIPSKFSAGLILSALGFLSLWGATTFFADSNHLVSGNWIFVMYAFQSTGELMVSGLGLSMITKLVPQKIVGFMMGAWFMCSATASIIGGFVAALASVPQKGLIVDHSISLHLYSSLFLKLGLVTLVAGLITFTLVPTLKKYGKWGQ